MARPNLTHLLLLISLTYFISSEARCPENDDSSLCAVAHDVMSDSLARVPSTSSSLKTMLNIVPQQCILHMYNSMNQLRKSIRLITEALGDDSEAEELKKNLDLVSAWLDNTAAKEKSCTDNYLNSAAVTAVTTANVLPHQDVVDYFVYVTSNAVAVAKQIFY